MLIEQGLYAQVVMLRQNYLKTTEENKNKNEAKFKLQGRSAISKRWFDINFHYIEEHFITREPDFYRIIYQRNEKTQDTNTFKMFEVPIRNSKCVVKLSFTVRPEC